MFNLALLDAHSPGNISGNTGTGMLVVVPVQCCTSSLRLSSLLAAGGMLPWIANSDGPFESVLGGFSDGLLVPSRLPTRVL